MTLQSTCIGILIFLMAHTLTAQEVTFSRDIAPIIYNKCTSCHRPGEVAPFSLTSYSEAASWAPMIAYVTSIKYMPPWKADPSYNSYLRENYLSDEEIQLIADWVAQGARQGDPALEPALPEFPTGSQVREPDLVLSFAESYTHKGNNRDEYRYFVLPTGLTEDRDLVGIELRPGNSAIVHHALIWEDVTGSAAAADAADPEYGFAESLDFLLNVLDDQFPGYVPGQRPILYSHGIAQKLHKESDLVIQMHYAPSSIDQSDSTTLNLFFAEEEATRYVKSHVMIPFGNVLTNGPFFIPANQVRQFHGIYTFQEDVTLLNTSPHMHYLGKNWDIIAIKPNGDTAKIVRINDWDFDWQGSYSFRKPMILPKGTKVHAYATYDNTSNNPANPNNPPKWMTWGENTEDEMYYLPFSWVSYQPGDEDLDFEEELSTSVGESPYLIKNKLYPIYPNPAHAEITIGYTLNKMTPINLYIVDQHGKPVKTLFKNQPHYPGYHRNNQQLTGLQSGIYFIVLETSEDVMTQKLVILD